MASKVMSVLAIATALFARPAMADCVVGASMAGSFQIIDSSTILLDGPSRILIKTYCYCFYARTRVQVLKDSFCDYQRAVLLVGDKVVDAQEVKGL